MPGLAPRRIAERAWHAFFALGQRCGFDLLPRGSYSQIPRLRKLESRDRWLAPRPMAGLRGMDPEAQLKTLADWLSAVPRPSFHEAHQRARAAVGHNGYGPVEASVLEAWVRHRAPRRIVQIGGGLSTAVLLRALDAGGIASAVTVIEPAPDAWLRARASEGRIALQAIEAQDAADALFAELAEGDLLFVDSSHRVCVDSEVNRLVLEVLPALATGVWVHFHDINFPYDYGRTTLGSDLWFHQEGALLMAFLLNNARFVSEVCLSLLHYERREALGELLPAYRPAEDRAGLAASSGDFPSALWLRVDERGDPR